MSTSSLALIVLFTGIIVVFSVLIILSIVIKGYGGLINLFSKGSEISNPGEKYNKQKEEKTDEISQEIVAVISAAVYSLLTSQNKKHKIVEINKHEIKDLSWRDIGVINNTKPFSR